MNVSRDIPTLLMKCENIINKSQHRFNVLASECNKVHDILDRLLPDSASRIACRNNSESEKSVDALRKKMHHLLEDMQTCLKISSYARDLSQAIFGKRSALDTIIRPGRDPQVDWAYQVALFGLQVDALNHFSSACFSKEERSY